MNLSKHAQTRMQQRGIGQRVVSLLDCFGERQYDNHDGEIVFFNKRSKRLLQESLDRADFIVIERKLDAYFVERQGVVVTVGHRYKKLYTN